MQPVPGAGRSSDKGSATAPLMSADAERRTSTSSTEVDGRRSTGTLTAEERGIKPLPKGPPDPSKAKAGRSPQHSHHHSSAQNTSEGDSSYSSLSYNNGLFSQTDNRFLKRIGACLQGPAFLHRMRPRYRQIFFCLIAEIVIAAALLLQFYSFRHSMQLMLLQQAKNELNLMDLTWARKTDDLALLAKGWSQDPRIIAFMQGDGASSNMTSSMVANMMSKNFQSLNVEWGLLLDNNMTVIMDINNNRTGQTFNPYNLVGRTLARPDRGQLQLAKSLSWMDFVRSSAPVYREATTFFGDQDFTHPFDTHDDSVMRYTVTPVFSNVNGTGTCLGVFVSGDIVNGKVPITYLTTMAFNRGFSGVYTRSSDGVNFIRSSTTTYIPESVPKSKGLSSSTIDPITPKVERDLLEKANSHPGQTFAAFDNGFAFAVKAAPNGMRNTTVLATAVTPAVMVRGLCLANDKTLPTLLDHTWYLLIAMLLINVLSVWASTSTFIAPLEEIAASLKARAKAGTVKGQKFTVKQISSLSLYAKYVRRVIITVATAVICSTLIAVDVKRSMKNVLDQLTLSELGIHQVAYFVGMDQTSDGLRSYANMPAFKQLAAYPNNELLVNETMAYLRREQQGRKLEILAMIHKDKTVLTSFSAFVKGTKSSDPGNSVSMTLQNALYYKLTIPWNYKAFLGIHPTIEQVHYIPGVPDSKMSPYNTGAQPLLRYATAPVYKPGNNDLTKPDAVLVGGDLLNGKTRVGERMLKVTGAGYVGHFAPDGNGDFNLLNSVLIDLHTKQAWTDVTIPTKILHDTAALKGSSVVGTAKIHGKEFSIAAKRVPNSRYVSPYGEMKMKNNPLAYVVYGKDREATKTVEQQQQYFVICMAILQVLMIMMLNYAAYQPFRKLMLVLEEKGFADRSARPTVIKVLRFYIIGGIASAYEDLRSRPLRATIKLYIGDPIATRVRRVRRTWRRVFGGARTHHKKRPKTSSRASVSSAVRPSQVVPEDDRSSVGSMGNSHE